MPRLVMKWRKQGRLFDVYYPAVLLYCGLLLGGSVLGLVQTVYAQVVSTAEIARRIDQLEKMNTDHRLTVVETNLEYMKEHPKDWTDWGTSGGVGLILMKYVYEAMGKRRGRKNDEATESE